MRLLLLWTVLGMAWCEDSNWTPIVPDSYTEYAKPDRSLHIGSQLKILNRRPPANVGGAYSKNPGSGSDQCSVFKVSMTQDLPYQYMEYETRLPDLKEFTLCMWTKFHNHSQDHPLFSYTVGDNPKEISSWISNNEDSSFFSMAVHGQTFFRLNYPLKLNTWYHSCQSWNGKTGEWQVWVNAERVGRGFHNRLVGHVIKGGGLAVSGQDQAALFNEDPLQLKTRVCQSDSEQSGLIGEITMLQLYHVALTAGKAHKDHKHHHAHHFRHDGTPIEPSAPPATEPPQPQMFALGNGDILVGGQLQRAPNLNLAGRQPQMIPVQLPNGAQIQQQYINGQLGSRIVAEQLLNSIPTNQLGGQIQQIPSNQLGEQQPQGQFGIPQNQGYFSRQTLGPSKGTSILLSGSLLNPANVQYIDDSAPHSIYRRDDKKRDKRDNPEKELSQERASGKKEKRGLVSLSDGSVVDEALLSPVLNAESDDFMFQQSLLDGLAGVVGNLPVQNQQKQTVDEREPAEAEVKAVMKVCSGCAPEPFKKALVLSWRATPKKLYGGAHYYKGLPICKAF